MARGQVIRLTTRTVEATELVQDRFAAALADGTVTVDEQQDLGVHIDNSYRTAQVADEAFGIGVTIMRAGVDSDWARRQGFDPSIPVADFESVA